MESTEVSGSRKQSLAQLSHQGTLSVKLCSGASHDGMVPFIFTKKIRCEEFPAAFFPMTGLPSQLYTFLKQSILKYTLHKWIIMCSITLYIEFPSHCPKPNPLKPTCFTRPWNPAPAEGPSARCEKRTARPSTEVSKPLSPHASNKWRPGGRKYSVTSIGVDVWHPLRHSQQGNRKCVFCDLDLQSLWSMLWLRYAWKRNVSKKLVMDSKN